MQDDFYGQQLDCGGIPIMASAAVDARALRIACDKISRILRNVPEVRARLVAAGAMFSVIGRDEQPSDLPHLRAWKNKVWVDNLGKKTTIDTRGRGYGGLHACCAEEILLDLPSNPYPSGQDICTHEFAHTIMDYGFTDLEHQQIEVQYRQALAKGLWKGAYAAVDAKEYWAELSMWFFGGHGDRTSTDSPHSSGRDALWRYDPESWQLLCLLYNQTEYA